MHDQDDGGSRATLRLRQQRFALMFAVLGATKDHEIAELTGYSIRTIRRARAGGQVGEIFVANTVYTLQQHAEELGRYGLRPSLDELFEVVEKREAAA